MRQLRHDHRTKRGVLQVPELRRRAWLLVSLETGSPPAAWPDRPARVLHSSDRPRGSASVASERNPAPAVDDGSSPAGDQVRANRPAAWPETGPAKDASFVNHSPILASVGRIRRAGVCFGRLRTEQMQRPRRGGHPTRPPRAKRNRWLSRPVGLGAQQPWK